MTAPYFHIGNVPIMGPLIMAPLAGYTSSSFRRLVKREGAALVVSETISVNALAHGNKKTQSLLAFREEERPVAIQLLGGDPAMIAEGVRVAESVRPDMIDINMGCPKPKILSKHEGSFLLKHPAQARAVVTAASRATSLPVTVKCRLPNHFSVPEFKDFLLSLIDCGAAALTLHPRTIRQRFGGQARWDLFAELAQSISVPFIASGDVRDTSGAREVLSLGCDALMIGRAAIGNPQIFSLIGAELRGEPAIAVSPHARLRTCITHLRMLRDEMGPTSAVYTMRKQLSPYFRGVTHSKQWVLKLMQIKDYDELCSQLGKILALLPV